MKKRVTLVLILAMPCLLLTACGSGMSGSSAPGTAVALSQACIASGCHASSYSKVTGKSIAEEWRAGLHYRMNVAGCRDCHTHSHPNSCASCHGSGTPVGTASDAGNASCFRCHDSAASKKPLDGKHISATVQNTNLSGPIPDLTDSAGFAVLRGTAYESQCNWCHNPHDNTVTEQHREWAESGHGDAKGEPFLHYDFKVRGTDNASPRTSAAADCVRCHTSTGYIAYVSSGFNDITPWGAARNPDGSVKKDSTGSTIPISNQKQVIYCNVCHDNGNGKAYSFRMRTVPQVTGFYNFSVAGIPRSAGFVTVGFPFPDVATSNICLPCHSGRESGRTVQAVFEALSSANKKSFYSNLSFINSHYLTAGGTVFKATGYEFAKQFGRSYTSASDKFMHDQIGRNNTSGTGLDGPCVTCHLRPRRHTFLPVERGDYVAAGLVDQKGELYQSPMNQSITALVSPVCNAVCHSWTASSLDAKKDGYRHALMALQKMIETSTNFSGRVPQYIASANPYFFNMSSNGTKPANYSKTSTGRTNAFKKWANEGNMGAAFNLNLLFRDYGGFAHNDFYAKRLIYDSVDWLDGATNYSAGVTINALDSRAWDYINPHPSVTAPYGDSRDRP